MDLEASVAQLKEDLESAASGGRRKRTPGCVQARAL
jgi:hypothetical protein